MRKLLLVSNKSFFHYKEISWLPAHIQSKTNCIKYAGKPFPSHSTYSPAEMNKKNA
ncbi:MAG: hypothetical protein ACTHMV_09285 [Chitinophagaceae bacterium]